MTTIDTVHPMSHFEPAGAVVEAPDSGPISQGPVTVGYTRVSAHRIGELHHSSSPPPPDVDLLQIVADLLLAAACADGEVCKRERHSLRKIQARLAGGVVPSWLEKHIVHFDPQTFDLEATAKRLRGLPLEQRVVRFVAPRDSRGGS